MACFCERFGVLQRPLHHSHQALSHRVNQVATELAGWWGSRGHSPELSEYQQGLLEQTRHHQQELDQFALELMERSRAQLNAELGSDPEAVRRRVEQWRNRGGTK